MASNRVEPTLEEQIDELERELTMRRRVYLHLVKTGKLGADKVAHSILVIETIINRLRRERQPGLL